MPAQDNDFGVTFECLNDGCGGTVLDLPDGYTDDSPVKCKTCGFTFGTWGDVKAQTLKLVARQAGTAWKSRP